MEDLGDIFGDFFGNAFGGQASRRHGRARGSDLQMEIKIDFREGVFGMEREVEIYKNVTCGSCGGSGAEGRKMTACLKCNGRGELRERKKTLFGVIQTSSVCSACGGTGEEPQIKCKDCLGLGITKQMKRLVISIPAGTEDGDILRLRGEGEIVAHGTPGDLYLKIRVKSDPEFRRKNNDIISKISISFPQATMGATIEVKTLDGFRNLKIPAGTQSGEILALRGLGVPMSRGRGDHLFEVIVRTPTKLSRKQKDLLEQLGKEL